MGIESPDKNEPDLAEEHRALEEALNNQARAKERLDKQLENSQWTPERFEQEKARIEKEIDDEHKEAMAKLEERSRLLKEEEVQSINDKARDIEEAKEQLNERRRALEKRK